MTLPKLNDVPPDLLTTLGASAMHALHSAGWLVRELTDDERTARQARRSATRQGQMKGRYSRGKRIA